MLQIYKADSLTIRSAFSLQKLAARLPEDMQKRAFRYKFENAGYDFAIGRLLLKNGLRNLGLIDRFENIRFSKKEKPYTEGVFFNISHTPGLVTCAFSENEIGIDVEKKRPINLPDFRAFFTAQEWSDINSSTDPVDTFFRFWVRKESMIKAFGVTLTELNKLETSLNRDEFVFEGETWCLKEIQFSEGYFGGICSADKIDAVEIVSVSDFF